MVVTTAAVEASLQIGYPAGIGIRHFLIFARTSLIRAASLSVLFDLASSANGHIIFVSAYEQK